MKYLAIAVYYYNHSFPSLRCESESALILNTAFASPVIKLSIVFFYRRIFSVRPFRVVADVLAALIIGWGLAVFLAASLQCRPLSAF